MIRNMHDELHHNNYVTITRLITIDSHKPIISFHVETSIVEVHFILSSNGHFVGKRIVILYITIYEKELA